MFVNVELDAYELLQQLVHPFRLLLHDLAHGLSLNEIRHDRPLAVQLCDFQDPGNVQTGFLHPCLVQRFVQHIRLGVILVEYLNGFVPVPVYGFDIAHCNHIV